MEGAFQNIEITVMTDITGYWEVTLTDKWNNLHKLKVNHAGGLLTNDGGNNWKSVFSEKTGEKMLCDLGIQIRNADGTFKVMHDYDIYQNLNK